MLRFRCCSRQISTGYSMRQLKKPKLPIIGTLDPGSATINFGAEHTPLHAATTLLPRVFFLALLSSGSEFNEPRTLPQTVTGQSTVRFRGYTVAHVGLHRGT